MKHIIALLCFALFACGADEGEDQDLGQLDEPWQSAVLAGKGWGTVDTLGSVNQGKNCASSEAASCSFVWSASPFPAQNMLLNISLDASWNTAQPGTKARAEHAIDLFCSHIGDINAGAAPGQPWQCARVSSGGNIVIVADHATGTGTTSTTSIGGLLSNSGCTSLGLYSSCTTRRVKFYDLKYANLSVSKGWSAAQSDNAVYHLIGNFIWQAVGIGRQSVSSGYLTYTTISTSVPLFLRSNELCEAKSVIIGASPGSYVQSGNCN